MKEIMIAILGVSLMLMSAVASSDMRMETTDGFCHAVTPEGVANGNDDNEVFLSNCQSSIRQNQDGTGDGNFVQRIEYTSLPFNETYQTTGLDSGIDCVMVDSNGTNYVTQDWVATYLVNYKGTWKSKGRGNNKRKAGPYSIEYRVECRNGAQQ